MRLFAAILVLAVAVRADDHTAANCQGRFITDISILESDRYCVAVSAFAGCLDNAGDVTGEARGALANARSAFGCGSGATEDESDEGALSFLVDSTGDVYFLRAQRTASSIFDMASELDNLQDYLDNLPELMQEWVSNKVAETRDEDVAQLRSALHGLQSDLEGEREERNRLRGQLSEIQEELAQERMDRQVFQDNIQSQTSQGINTALSGLQNQGNTIQSSMDNIANSVGASLSSAWNSLEGEIERATSAEAQLDWDMKDSYATLSEELDELADALSERTPIIWSGGCRHGSYGGGWDTYCFNGNDHAALFPAALYRDHIEVTGSNRFRFRKPGFYRLNWWAIQHGCGSYNVDWNTTWNGGHRHLGYAHRDSKPGGWFSNSMDQTWAFKEGDTFWMTVHGGWCSPWRWHSWNHDGHHSRMQVSYVGPLRDGQ